MWPSGGRQTTPLSVCLKSIDIASLMSTMSAVSSGTKASEMRKVGRLTRVFMPRRTTKVRTTISRLIGEVGESLRQWAAVITQFLLIIEAVQWPLTVVKKIWIARKSEKHSKISQKFTENCNKTQKKFKKLQHQKPCPNGQSCDYYVRVITGPR